VQPEHRAEHPAAKKYDRSKVEEGDRRIVDAMLNHTRPVESAATVASPTNELVAAAEWFMEVAYPAGKEYEVGQRFLYWQARDRLKAALAAVKGDTT
jgi:hypothetical protein